MTYGSNLFSAYYNAQHSSQPAPDPKPPLPEEYTEGYALYQGGGVSYVFPNERMTIDDEWETLARPRLVGTRCAIGGGYLVNDDGFGLWFLNDVPEVRATFGARSNSSKYVVASDLDFSVLHTYRMKLATGQLWIDGELIGQTQDTPAFARTPSYFELFGFRRQGSSQESFYGVMGETKIRRAGAIFMWFVPAKRNEDNIYGMYDLKNGVFYIMNNSWFVNS